MFCKIHKWQPITLTFSVLVIISVFAGVFQDVIMPIKNRHFNPINDLNIPLITPNNSESPPNIDGLNILVFDAAYSDQYIDVAYKLKKISRHATIDMQNNWRNKHMMEKTRIVLLSNTHLIQAKKLAKWLRIEPLFIDYNDQTHERKRKLIPGESLFDKNTFVNITKTRDIVVFLGKDYENKIH